MLSLPSVQAMDDPLTMLLAWLRPAWHRDAACIEHPELNFLPERGESTKAQLAVCSNCLVRGPCLEMALAGGRDTIGVWGATTGLQRRDLQSPLNEQQLADQRARRRAKSAEWKTENRRRKAEQNRSVPAA